MTTLSRSSPGRDPDDARHPPDLHVAARLVEPGRAQAAAHVEHGHLHALVAGDPVHRRHEQAAQVAPAQVGGGHDPVGRAAVPEQRVAVGDPEPGPHHAPVDPAQDDAGRVAVGHALLVRGQRPGDPVARGAGQEPDRSPGVVHRAPQVEQRLAGLLVEPVVRLDPRRPQHRDGDDPCGSSPSCPRPRGRRRARSARTARLAARLLARRAGRAATPARGRSRRAPPRVANPRPCTSCARR